MAHKVFVGLSGGVDSAVSAALLKERGFEVVGAFIKIWRPEFIECTWKDDRVDAMRTCAALSIPFREIDLSTEYKKDVVDTMLRDYARGITPNPDVLCNATIKFGAFSSWARRQGADRIATGHYARIREVEGHVELLRGVDREKDQSYFLYSVGQRELARALFPVGGMHKREVRERAKAFGLPVADKRDSQGLCFVGDVSMPDFLGRYLALERGPVMDTSGRVIGEHEGAAVFTLGERHGFTITDPAVQNSPHYVVGIDVAENAISVSSERAHSWRRAALLADIRWVNHAPANGAATVVQSRYRERPIRAIVEDTAQGLCVVTQDAHLFAPGQSLVIYEGDVCLGGGVIQKPLPRGVEFSPDAPAGSAARQVQ